jgi:hypothetical protein
MKKLKLFLIGLVAVATLSVGLSSCGGGTSSIAGTYKVELFYPNWGHNGEWKSQGTLIINANGTGEWNDFPVHGGTKKNRKLVFKYYNSDYDYYTIIEDKRHEIYLRDNYLYLDESLAQNGYGKEGYKLTKIK